MDLFDAAVPPVRLRLRGAIDQAKETLALRAALAAAHLLGVASGIFLRRLRAMRDPLATALAQLKEAELKATLLARAAEALGARFDKLPERRRPFYTPRQRFQILEIKNLLGWPADQTARIFRICTQTILNWEKTVDPDAKTVGKTVRQAPPVTRFADAVRNTLHLMARSGFGSDETAALLLARAGWKLSARSVRRITHEKPTWKPTPPSDSLKPARPVIARFVHHVWMMDVTLVPSFLGPDLFLACVFDAFSRAPLALQTFDRKPGAAAMARLLRTAARAFGKAKYLITRQGLPQGRRPPRHPPTLRHPGQALRNRAPRTLLENAQGDRPIEG